MALPTPSPVSVTCCLPGYTYNSGTTLCDLISDPTQHDTPHPCGCCPPGYTFIDGSGQFMVADLSFHTIVGPGPISQWYNSCGVIVNMGWVNAIGPATIACPCCPAGYIYWSDNNVCILATNPKVLTDPIPCIPCVCVVPPPPPPCVGCTNQNLVSISFAWDNTVKNCTDCDKQGEPKMTNDPKFNAFLPYFLIDPVINFRLDD